MESLQQEDHLDLSLTLALPEYAHNKSDNVPNYPPRNAGRQPKSCRRNKPKAAGKGKKIPAPYPWAKKRRAKVRTLTYLLDHGIYNITGQVKCTTCNTTFTEKFNIQDKVMKTGIFIQNEEREMHDRVPERWTKPRLMSCGLCNKDNCCEPVISGKKRSIDWLFLFLGGYIGCCSLAQLKYFLKHAKVHRTGPKAHLVYSTYIELFNQLDSIIW